MKPIIFDFERIGTINDFYAIAKNQLMLPDYFGNNLDALWDWVTAGMELPATINFSNMTLNQLETFEGLIELFEDACEEMPDDISFEYYIKKP